eukprot:Skav230566  [mRNA]  locus=scaffold1941:23497:23916:- [translate_table: standard]
MHLLTQGSLKPDVICYNAAMSSGEKCSRWEMVSNLLASMPALQIQNDIISCNVAISSLEKAGFLWYRSLSFFEARADEAVGGVDVITCNGLLSSYEKSSQWSLAIQHFGHIQQHRCSASIRSLGAVVSACDAWICDSKL